MANAELVLAMFPKAVGTWSQLPMVAQCQALEQQRVAALSSVCLPSRSLSSVHRRVTCVGQEVEADVASPTLF